MVAGKMDQPDPDQGGIAIRLIRQFDPKHRRYIGKFDALIGFSLVSPEASVQVRP
jgi:hypothetical protein